MTKQVPSQFSNTLEAWLKSGKNQTLAGLIAVFAEKSFAIVFLLLMALPALPLPTGGITHITEFITMLLCLELIIGRQTIWLPRRWLNINVGKHLSAKATKRLLAIIRWFERLSRQRGNEWLSGRVVLSVLAAVMLIFTVAAFVAPPFSGLDTLPSLGVVTMSLALILDDALILVIGILLGALGIGLEIAAGTALYSGLTHFL
jgi:hypothetical protein